MPRISKILRSTQARQAKRLDLALLRAGFVLVVMSWGVSATLAASSPTKMNLGHNMLLWFYPASVLLLAYLAGRLNRDTVGDATSGYLSLISLTGTTNTQWMLTRFLQNWIGFLSVWVVRLPFLYLFFTLGGIRASELILSEITLLFLYGVVTSRAMLLAHNSDNRKSADWTGIGTIFFLEILLSVGKILTGLMTFLGVPVSLWLRQPADIMYGLTLQNWFTNLRTGGFTFSDLSRNMLLYTALAVYWIWQYRRVLYSRIGETPELVLESKKEKAKALKKRPPLPRCWDDALAWQSYVYYAGGHDNTTGRVVLYGLSFLFISFCVATELFIPVMVIALIGSGVIYMNMMNSPSHYFEKEIKAKTLGSLIMTPHNGLDLFRGWRRGMLWLSIPDHIYAVLVSIVMFFVDPVIPYIIVCIVITVNCSGPLLMLSGLVPISFKSLGTAFFVVFGLFTTIGAGIALAWADHPAAFPFGFIPLFWGFNYIIKHYFIERWLISKIAAEV